MKKYILSFVLIFSAIPSFSFAAVDPSIDYTKYAPFTISYESDPSNGPCWRAAIHTKAVSEFSARDSAFVNQEILSRYMTDNGVSAPNFDAGYPKTVETTGIAIYNSSTNIYHYWVAVVAPKPSYFNKNVTCTATSSTIGTSGPGTGTNTGPGSGVGNTNGSGSTSGSGSSSGTGTNVGTGTTGSASGSGYTGAGLNSKGFSGLVADCNRGDLVRTNTTDPHTGQVASNVSFVHSCGFSDLMVMLNHLINFALFVLATPLFAIGLCWAGFKLLFSGGSEEAMGDAKKMFVHMVLGYIIALIAWIVIKTIMVMLGFAGTGIFLNLG